MNLSELKSQWVDEENYHKEIHESFIKNIEGVEWMNAHRDWVSSNVFGFGEKSFYWLWKLIVDEMPSEFSFLEIGVFKGQILSLIKMLASATGRSVERYGVSPLDSTGIDWESDYEQDIITLHDTFFVPKDYVIYKGLSANENIIEQAHRSSPYNIIYIDGDHSYDGCYSDLKHYATMVKQGGYLAIDDACGDMKMPWGYFQGILSVTEATLNYMGEFGDDWEFIGNVMHLRLYRRK